MKYTGPITADVGFHVGFVTKAEDEPRRHKSRCVYFQEGKCMCGKLRCYTCKCPGSAQCSQYSETEPESLEYILEKRAEERRRAESTRNIFITKMKETPKMSFLNKSFDNMDVCPVCNSRLFRVKGRENVKECKYCTSKFVRVHQNVELDTDAETFFIMNKSATTINKPTGRSGSACKWNKCGKCQNYESEKCGLSCRRCSQYMIDVTKKSISIAMKSPA